MKIFLTMLALCSVGAFADEECSTIWVHHPWNSCRKGNGPDLKADMSNVPIEKDYVGFGPVGTDDNGHGGGLAEAHCNNNDVVGLFNKSEGPRKGLLAVKIFNTAEIGYTESYGKAPTMYRYYCKLAVKKYPIADLPNALCGVNKAIWSGYTRNPTKPDAETIKGSPVCLSCDYDVNDLNGNPVEGANCLATNIETLINKQPVNGIDIRPDDVDKVVENVKAVIKYDAEKRRILSIKAGNILGDFLKARGQQESK